MKLYVHPASTVSRPILQFVADHNLDIEVQIVNIFEDEHLGEAFTKKNPSLMIPLLEDGDFSLTESAAILRFLGDKIASPTYPKDLYKRAKVNEMLDWLNTNFYRDWGYGLIYPQVFPTHKNVNPVVQADNLAWAYQRSERWLRVLNDHLIGADHSYLCGDVLTIADYFGLTLITLGELTNYELGAYPNILRWQDNLKKLPSYEKTYASFNSLAAKTKDLSFLRIPAALPAEVAAPSSREETRSHRA